uniref:Putative secreted protein n=1 Tax=Amblyomma triste TaxID=251400 RepID=A0A023G1J4_AMBTT
MATEYLKAASLIASWIVLCAGRNIGPNPQRDKTNVEKMLKDWKLTLDSAHEGLYDIPERPCWNSTQVGTHLLTHRIDYSEQTYSYASRSLTWLKASFDVTYSVSANGNNAQLLVSLSDDVLCAVWVVRPTPQQEESARQALLQTVSAKDRDKVEIFTLEKKARNQCAQALSQMCSRQGKQIYQRYFSAKNKIS